MDVQHLLPGLIKCWVHIQSITHLILQMEVKHSASWWQHFNGCIHMHPHTQKSLPLWVVGLQDRTPMCYSVKPLFIVLFLQVYKILVWTTLLLCVWKSHIWSLLVCHEWLWGIRANAVAWDPSYNNTASFEGPTMTAKTTARALPGVYISNIKQATGDPCCVYWPTCLACCQEQFSHKSFLWHHHMSPLARVGR